VETLLTIVIPTRNRVQILGELLESIRQLNALHQVDPAVIIADNDSNDDTYNYVTSQIKAFPTKLQIMRVVKPGKSAAINAAVRSATGEFLAFLDDDVVVDKAWLTALVQCLHEGKYQAGQGSVRLQSPAGDDPEIIKLVNRYRTIPTLKYDPGLKMVHSLNGANFFLARKVFDRLGGFDERLGPGASGTSEDVDLARRLGNAGIAIGYLPQAIVYHGVEPDRLTEAYFELIHRRQGISRYLMGKRNAVEIIFNLAFATTRYFFYTLIGIERKRYRNKGRIYHYIGMMHAQRNQVDRQDRPRGA